MKPATKAGKSPVVAAEVARLEQFARRTAELMPINTNDKAKAYRTAMVDYDSRYAEMFAAMKLSF